MDESIEDSFLYNVCLGVPITLPSVIYTEENGSNINSSNPENTILADISCSYNTPTVLGTLVENTTDTVSPKVLQEMNLRSLLTAWKLASLTEELMSQNVFVDILKIIKRHHIERLLRNFDMGTQILFEHNLEQWRESIGLPLGYASSGVHSYQNLYNSPSSSASSSRTHTPTLVKPYDKTPIQNSNSSSIIQLATILNGSSRGTVLVEYYNKFSKFQEEQRSLLISLIALHFQEKGVKMTLADSHNIEREIFERFPSEKLEYYRTSKRGKIYTKFCYMTTSFKAAVSKHVSEGEKQDRKGRDRESRHNSDLEPEKDAESCLRALKFDNLTSEQFDATWKACCQFRLEFIKANDTANIIKKWPFYRNPSGYRLIDMDFKVAFRGKDGLLKEWDGVFEKIVSFLIIDSHIKDKNARQLLEKLKNDDNTSITEICMVHCTEIPYFAKSPKDVNVVLGQSVTLPCEVTPDKYIKYYWELNGSKITNTTRRYQQGSNLHITRVDRERDSGQFTCIAEDTTGQSPSITSSPASINIQWINEPSVQLQEPASASFIQRGSDVTLRCHVDASGEVHFEWFRNADRLTKSPRLEIKKKRLHIKAVEPSDNGVYRCVVQNEAGTRHSSKNFALAVAGNKTALIKTVPSNQVVKQGGTAFFDCSYENADVTEWNFKDIEPLKTDSRRVVHSNGTLQINNVTESDNGLYSCVGIQSGSTEVPQSYTAELRLAYLEPFTSTSFEPPLPEDSKQIVGEGSFFQLTCLEPNSFPPAKKWWQNHNGHTISDSGEIRVDDGRLIIDSIKKENAGVYKCVAESIAGTTEKSVEITATSKPEITSHPTSVTVDENEKSVLTCGFESNSLPYTIVRWLKDGKSLKHDYEDSSSNHQRIRVHKQNGTLVIHNTQTSDRGEYVCEVVTTGHKPVLSKPATISVIEQLKFSPPPVNKKMELGSVAKIHCKAQGTPPPIIHWEKEGQSPESFASHISDTNGTLHFNGVQAEDRGRYNCIASNSQGVIKASINIDVVVAPKFSVLPKNPTEVIEGQPIMLDCVVEGDPKPTIHWDKNLKMNDFNLSRFRVLPNGTLFISEVHKEDENTYGCTAGSSAGLNRKEVQLIVHSQDGYHPETDGDSTVTKAVLITMSVAGAYIILVIGLMVWCRYRRRSRKLPIGDITKTENGDVEHTELKDGANGGAAGPSKTKVNGVENHKEGQRSDGAETTNSQSSSQSKKSKSSNYDKLALSRNHLKDIKLIGRGEFGDVMVAKIAKSVLSSEKRTSQIITPTDPPAEDKEIPVLVKSLTQTKDENCLAEFKRELDMFTKVSHENITKLFGLCREVEPHYLILEYTDWGDLKKFLLATQSDSTPTLTPVQSVAILHQLSRAMDHLASSRMVHKDLAARNCLVTSTLLAKIGLPRLTRDPYSQEYCKHVNQIIPLRWLPYEAVYEDEYSTKSDMYSFGVLIWEIFAQGELPQSKINDTSFLNKLKEKQLEWKPHPSTPETLLKMQESCWDVDPKNRPSFSEVSQELGEILKSM